MGKYDQPANSAPFHRESHAGLEGGLVGSHGIPLHQHLVVRRKVRKLPWWGWLFFTLPMVIDGGTHFVSDFAGIGQGFRDSNAWLAVLTQNAFSPTLYSGDACYFFTGIARLIPVIWIGGRSQEMAYLMVH